MLFCQKTADGDCECEFVLTIEHSVNPSKTQTTSALWCYLSIILKSENKFRKIESFEF